MYLIVTEHIYTGYKKEGEEEYGYCTCGTKFNVPVVKGQQGDCIYDTSVHCPNCGSTYGHRDLTVTRRNGALYLSYSQTARFPLYRIEVEDETVSLIKEAVKRDWDEYLDIGGPIPVISSMLKFDTAHGLRILSVAFNGQEAKLTATNVERACTGINADEMKAAENAARFKEEMVWIQKAMGYTSSLAVAAKALHRYPVLDSLYEERQRKKWNCICATFPDALKCNGVTAGERSIKLAFNLPKLVLDLLFRGLTRFGAVQKVVKQFGLDLGAEALSVACDILQGKPNNVESLATFLAERTPAERRRLKTYLTEEVAIYQGIEDPGAAWNLLSDYIKMSSDMEVHYELCPKSLKLKHDLAVRNHRLVLEEIERKKFKERVAQENYSRLAWTSKNGKWAVLVPEEVGDLVKEGSELSHCVGSYASYVIEGKKRICFLRKTDQIDKPLLTLTVNNEDCCSTYLGFDNRYATPEEVAALREWTRARMLTLSEQ